MTKLIGAPSSPDLVVAVTPGGLIRSTDAGATWALVGDGKILGKVPYIVALDPADPAFLVASTGDFNLFVSGDNGMNWRLSSASRICMRSRVSCVPGTCHFAFATAWLRRSSLRRRSPRHCCWIRC